MTTSSQLYLGHKEAEPTSHVGCLRQSDRRGRDLLSRPSAKEHTVAVEITHVRYGGNQKTESSIEHYRWTNRADGNVGTNDKPSMVEWVDGGGRAYVGSGAARAEVGVVRPSGERPYLRTHADGRWTNNLLSLPTF